MVARCEIDFVYFDLGNVLLSFDPELACRNLAARLEVSVPQARAAVYHSGLQDRFEHGQLSPQAFAAAVCQQLGVSLGPSAGTPGAEVGEPPWSEVLDAISEMFTPIDEMTGVVERVRQSGRRVGILSNTCHAHWDWIRRQAYPVLGGPFEITILSYEVGAMKPDERIYLAAEQAANTAPGRILFLDDKLENIEAAWKRGWKAAQCFGGEQAIAVLRSYGVMGDDH